MKKHILEETTEHIGWTRNCFGECVERILLNATAEEISSVQTDFAESDLPQQQGNKQVVKTVEITPMFKNITSIVEVYIHEYGGCKYFLIKRPNWASYQPFDQLPSWAKKLI